jgi:hypothetical protein
MGDERWEMGKGRRREKRDLDVDFKSKEVEEGKR